MNKYLTFSKEAQRKRRLFKKCISKVKYSSKEAAYQRGQEIYFCTNCNNWHRSGTFAKFVATVKKINNK